MGIEIIAAWFFKDLRSRARTDLEGLGTLRNPYRLDAALLPQNIPHNFAICFAYCSWYSLRIDVHPCSDVRMTRRSMGGQTNRQSSTITPVLIPFLRPVYSVVQFRNPVTNLGGHCGHPAPCNAPLHKGWVRCVSIHFALRSCSVWSRLR